MTNALQMWQGGGKMHGLFPALCRSFLVGEWGGAGALTWPVSDLDVVLKQHQCSGRESCLVAKKSERLCYPFYTCMCVEFSLGKKKKTHARASAVYVRSRQCGSNQVGVSGCRGSTFFLREAEHCSRQHRQAYPAALLSTFSGEVMPSLNVLITAVVAFVRQARHTASTCM